MDAEHDATDYPRQALLVEDDPTIGRLLQRFLERRGFAVTRYESGTEARDAATSAYFPLILLDWMLPGCTGLEICRTLRSEGPNRDSIVLMLTARDSRADLAQALETGVDDYIVKPISMPELEVHLSILERRLLDRLRRGRAEMALRQQHAFLQRLLETIPLPIYYKDEQGRYLGGNAAFAAFVDTPLEALAGRTVGDVALASVAAEQEARDRELLAAGGTQRYELEVTRSGKGPRSIVFDKAVYTDGAGRTTGLVGVMSDVTEQKEMMERLRLMATNDDLTGLFNRRNLLENLARTVSTARRYGHDLALCMCDIDHFKAVNDRHGHLAGDEVLRRFGRLVHKELRTSDFAGRYGGDEFCLVLPHTPMPQAVTAIERIRRGLEAMEFDYDGQAFQVTGSFGITGLGERFAEADELIALADQALYQAKRESRNSLACLA